MSPPPPDSKEYLDRELLNRRCAYLLGKAMQSRNLTGVALSKQTGIPTSNISRYLNGTSIMPLPAFICISNVLGCNPSAIIKHATAWASNVQRERERRRGA